MDLTKIFDKLKVSTLFRAFYTGFTMLFIVYIIDPSYIKNLLDTVGAVGFSFLIFFGGLIYFVFHRYIFGELILYNFQVGLCGFWDIFVRNLSTHHPPRKKNGYFFNYISDTLFFVEVLGLSYFDIRAAYQLITKVFYKGLEFEKKDARKNEITKQKEIETMAFHSTVNTIEVTREFEEALFVQKLTYTKDKIDEEHTDIHLLFIAAELCLIAYLLTKLGIAPTSTPNLANYFGMLSMFMFGIAFISDIRQHIFEARIIKSIANENHIDQLKQFLRNNGFVLRTNIGSSNDCEWYNQTNIYLLNKSIAFFWIYAISFISASSFVTIITLIVINW